MLNNNGRQICVTHAYKGDYSLDCNYAPNIIKCQNQHNKDCRLIDDYDNLKMDLNQEYISIT